MKRPISVIPIVVTCVGLALGLVICGPGWAAEWQVPLEVTNGAAERDTIVFGVHPDGTPGVDPDLGEVELPPWPPSSLFEVRFAISGCEGLKLDLRDTTYTQRYHTIEWQEGDGGYPVTVRWDRYSLPYASLYISDGYGGVFIPPVNMYEADSLLIPPSQSFIDILTLEVIPGVSPGADPEIGDIPDAEVFEGQRFADYNLDDCVEDPDTPDSLLQWFVTENQALVFDVDADRVLHIDVPDGWTGVETVTITVRDPEHHTDQTYATFTVVPGGLPAWEIPMTVSNAGEEERGAYFGIHPEATDGIDSGLGEVALPPWPPSDVFDARFELPDGFTYSVHDIRQSAPDTLTYLLCWQAGDGGYPMTVRWSTALPLGDFFISDEMGGVFIPPVSMRDTSEIAIPPEQSFIDALQIKAVAAVDTVPPTGPDTLRIIEWTSGVDVTLGWTECIEDHFAYYEILYDTLYFETSARFSWDWSEDPDLAGITTVTTTIPLSEVGEFHMFRIRAWDTFGNVGDTSNLVSVPDCSGAPPPGVTVLPALSIRPNPMRQRTAIHFSAPGNGKIRLAVYTVSGRRVTVLPITCTETKTGTAVWNGCDLNGHRVLPGVYFCRLETGKGKITKKVVVLE